MSIVLLESFESMTKWAWLPGGGPSAGARTGSGRDSHSSIASDPWTFTVAQQHDTLIIGMAIRLNTTNYDNRSLLTITATGGLAGRLETIPGLVSGVGLRYVRAKDGVVLASNNTGLMAQGFGATGFYHVELKVKLHATLGTVEIKTNEVVRAAASNVDTLAAGAGALWSSFTLPSTALPNALFTYDDLYVCNGAGSAPTNDFMGDTTINKILPNANGDTNLWVGSDGNSTDNYLLVDENVPSATDYVESGTLTATDLYNFQNLPAGVSGRQVFGLEQWAWAKSTALPNTMALVTKNGVLETEGPTETMTTSDVWYVHRQEAKPGGGAWTTADVDSAQHGQRVKS